MEFLELFTPIDIAVGAIGASAGLVALVTGIVAYRRYRREIASGERPDPAHEGNR